MGLDLRHYHASEARSGRFLVMDDDCRAAAAKYADLLVVLTVDEAGAPSTEERHAVLYVREVGYQRKGMERGFYASFAPDLVTIDRRVVETMLGLTETDARAHFKTCFLDNWDEERSLVVVSF